MSTTRSRSPLDEAVGAICRRLAERSVPPPQALFLMATGASLFAERLSHGVEVELGSLGGFGAPWDEEVLHAGRLGGLDAWLLSDVSGEPVVDARAAWTRGLPLWVAAAQGACVCVHTSAGSALAPEDRERPHVPLGGFAVVRDHLNLSGETPLRGLGDSDLGPLFPDLSLLHHLGLRRAALEHAEKLGLPAAEAIAACTPGPALETPAERRMLARAGADVAVQSLAVPLLAAAHAGLAVLAIVAVVDADGAPTDVARLVELAAQAEPSLEDLLLELTEDLERAVAVLSAGEGR